MFKLINNSLSITIPALFPKYTHFQTIRWARKPRWLPTAKTKLFRVSARPVIPAEDKEELKRLYNIYRTQIKSLRSYFKEKYSAENLEKFDAQQYQIDIMEDFKRCSKINDAWNEEVKKHRELRTAKELEDNIEIAKQRFLERQQREIKKVEEIEQSVKLEKEAAKSFITRESLDEAIERAINNPVDYNYSIDLKGNKTYGRDVVQSENDKLRQ